MSALVERVIAARDGLKGLNISDYALIREARDAMAEVANRLSEMQTLLDRLNEHARPSNWDDDDDPEQVAVWRALDKLMEAAR
jgi:hypothetical protein